MVSRIHRAVQHRSTVPGIEPMTLVSDHHFPRHSHDQFSIGVIAFGAQRSWRVGQVSASAGDVIMANPGETHDGVPLDNNARQWRMIYIDPALLAGELKEETVRPVEIVHPVAQDLLLARHFARLFACLTAARSDRLAREVRARSDKGDGRGDARGTGNPDDARVECATRLVFHAFTKPELVKCWLLGPPG
jgi:hypothetical protein